MLLNMVSAKFIRRGEVFDLYGVTTMSSEYSLRAQIAIHTIFVDRVLAVTSFAQQARIACIAQRACGDKLVEGILFSTISMPKASELETLEIPSDVAAAVRGSKQTEFAALVVQTRDSLLSFQRIGRA